jgi:hypothetical protein
MREFFEDFLLQIAILHQQRTVDYKGDIIKKKLDLEFLQNLYIDIVNCGDQQNIYYFECQIETYKSTLYQRYSEEKESYLGKYSLIDFVLTEKDELVEASDLVFGYPKETFDTPETRWIYDSVILNRKLKINHLEEILIRDLNENELDPLNDRQKILLLFESGALKAIMDSYLFKNKTLSVGKLADLLSLIFPIKSGTIKPMINPLFNTSSTSNSLIDTEINKNAVLSAIQKLDISKNEGGPSKN